MKAGLSNRSFGQGWRGDDFLIHYHHGSRARKTSQATSATKSLTAILPRRFVLRNGLR
jgi:hypothetical protein